MRTCQAGAADSSHPKVYERVKWPFFQGEHSEPVSPVQNKSSKVAFSFTVWVCHMLLVLLWSVSGSTAGVFHSEETLMPTLARCCSELFDKAKPLGGWIPCRRFIKPPRVFEVHTSALIYHRRFTHTLTLITVGFYLSLPVQCSSFL